MSRRHLTAFLVALAVALTLAAAGQAEAANVLASYGDHNSTSASTQTIQANPKAYYHQIYIFPDAANTNATGRNSTIQGVPAGTKGSQWVNASFVNGTGSAPDGRAFTGNFQQLRLYSPSTGINGSWSYSGEER
jgi:hypothetical protein